MKPCIAVILLVALAPYAGAQQAPGPNPADPAAPAPRLRYESAFAEYAPYREPQLAGWRELNEAVFRAGGHRGLFGSGQGTGGQADPAKPAAEQSPTRGAPQSPRSGHAGH